MSSQNIILISTDLIKDSQAINLLGFLKDQGREVVLYGHMDELTSSSLKIPLCGEMEEAIRSHPAEHVWIVEGDLPNLLKAKKMLGEKVRTIMVSGETRAMTVPVTRGFFGWILRLLRSILGGNRSNEVDVYIPEINRLIGMLFPQKI
jgi:hypothetical protein